MHKKRTFITFFGLIFLILTALDAQTPKSRFVPPPPPPPPPVTPPITPPIGPDGELSQTFSAFAHGTTLVGTVFEDPNADGIQQKEERGIPGVRLATATGVVIETDAYGRFHIPDVTSGGFGKRGHNLILKVDPASLPKGAIFTTENPRVYRITSGQLNRVDFGIKLPKQEDFTGKKEITRKIVKIVNIKIGSIFFDSDKACIRPDQVCEMDKIAQTIRKYRGGKITIVGNTDARAPKWYNTKLAKRRAETVYKELRHRLGKDLIRKVKITYQDKCGEVWFNPKYDWWGKPNPPRLPKKCTVLGTECEKTRGGAK